MRSIGCQRLILCLVILCGPPAGYAGGPRLVAGSSFFDPGVMGTPVHWAGGRVDYFVDQGPLSAGITNAQAIAMVDAAAAIWNAVPTSAVVLTNRGTLLEDVNGSSSQAGDGTLLQPSDVSAPAAAPPLGIVFDYDGSVMDAILGAYASDPTNCEFNGVRIWLDNILPDATVKHALMILNGRCTD